MLLLILLIILFLFLYFYNFNSEKFVSNSKIDFITSEQFPNICDYKSAALPKKEGESIYIKTDNLTDFVNNYLPKIKYKFVLVTGCSDYSIPDDFNDEVNKLLSSELLLKWYAQNYKENISNKIENLPIGLDLHTLTREALWGNIQSYDDQIQDVINISNIQNNKKILCYSNFHLNMSNRKYSYDRQEALYQIPKELVYYEPKQIDRIESWKNMIKYKYVISPMGNGLDCHRTWEALILGCVPIVKKSNLDSLYENLPVLIVENWYDITYDLLNNFNKTNIDMSSLYMDYWSNKINKYKKL